MHLADLFLAAEPASIFYMVTGAIGLLYARSRRAATRTSTAMFFCSKAGRENLENISLTTSTAAPVV
jgi:hypothetical protein